MTPVDVAVAVVRNAEGHVLLAERTARQVAAGFWELPGGKIERGETPAQAAMRELAEETGLEARGLRPLMTYDHAFPTKTVRLHIFAVTSWAGTPSGREGQRLAWTDPASPRVAPVLSSNTRVLAALGLPPEIALAELAGPAPALLAHAHGVLSSGARLMLVRGDRLAPDQKVALARRFCALAHEFGAKILLAGSALEASRAGADGLHSSAAALRSMLTRPPVLLWSVVCDTADDLARADALGADLALTPEGLADHVPVKFPVFVPDRADRPSRAIRAGSTRIAADATGAGHPATFLPPPSSYTTHRHF
jgi:8-oxo-dGTP diphosphatase